MAFSEIVSAAKNLLDRVGGRPALQTLSLEAPPQQKGVGDIAFDAVSAAWYARNGYGNIAALLSGGLPAWSGEHVSLQTALNHATVFACNRVISETVGMLPLNMIQVKGQSTRVADDHPMYSVMHNAPNEEMSAMEYREASTSHVVLEGNTFARIIRRRGTGVAIGMHLLLPEHVSMDREKGGKRRLVYSVKTGVGEAGKTFTVEAGKPQDIFHMRGIGRDGLRGYSVLTMARQSIGTAIAAEHNVARFYANGGRVPYVIERSAGFTRTEDMDKFRADWDNTYSEPGRAPIMTPGMTYKQIGINLKDSQMLEMRLYTVSELCRFFRVSPYLVGELSHATFGNVSSLFTQFKVLTLDSWLKRWEQSLFRCVLTPEEQAAGYHFRHNPDALLRGDLSARMTAYSQMFSIGMASVNELRSLQDWDPIEGGDEHYAPLAMAPIGKPSPVSQSEEELLNPDF